LRSPAPRRWCHPPAPRGMGCFSGRVPERPEGARRIPCGGRDIGAVRSGELRRPAVPGPSSANEPRRSPGPRNCPAPRSPGRHAVHIRLLGREAEDLEPACCGRAARVSPSAAPSRRARARRHAGSRTSPPARYPTRVSDHQAAHAEVRPAICHAELTKLKRQVTGPKGAKRLCRAL
jgi:hypothetical protein